MFTTKPDLELLINIYRLRNVNESVGYFQTDITPQM